MLLNRDDGLPTIRVRFAEELMILSSWYGIAENADISDYWL